MSTIRANAILDGAGGNTATINGITPALATQAQATAGSDNTTLMTPLRVKQAMDARFFPTGSFTNVTASRVAGTAYQNTTGAWLLVAVTASNNGASIAVGPSAAVMQTLASTNAAGATTSALIPPGAYYRFTGSVISSWFEG